MRSLPGADWTEKEFRTADSREAIHRGGKDEGQVRGGAAREMSAAFHGYSRPLHGVLASHGERTAGTFTLHVEIPVGLTAEVRIPRHEGARSLSESGVTIWGIGATRVDGLGEVTSSDGWLSFEAGSGPYELVLMA
jgi:hypothetical protein